MKMTVIRRALACLMAALTAVGTLAAVGCSKKPEPERLTEALTNTVTEAVTEAISEDGTETAPETKKDGMFEKLPVKDDEKKKK